MANPKTAAGPKTKGTKIVRCSCLHPFQDEKNGPGRRVHNAWKDGWRCTVCNGQKSESVS